MLNDKCNMSFFKFTFKLIKKHLKEIILHVIYKLRIVYLQTRKVHTQ